MMMKKKKIILHCVVDKNTCSGVHSSTRATIFSSETAATAATAAAAAAAVVIAIKLELNI